MHKISYYKLPKEVTRLVGAICLQGFSLTLVGGSVRDFLLYGSYSKDLDFEIIPTEKLSHDQIIESLDKLKDNLSKDYTVTVAFKFNVLTIELGEYSVELAPARLEKYHNDGTVGHSDFDVEFTSVLDFKQSFKRRDFTINAMGINFKVSDDHLALAFVDPFNGRMHLQEAKLVACDDETFIFDPVRFVRAIRFSIVHNFEISNKLKVNLVKMSLESLTLHYFFSEAFKSRDTVFFKLFFNITSILNIKVNDKIKRLSFLSDLSDEEDDIASVSDLLNMMVKNKFPLSEVEIFCIGAQIKKSVFKKIKRYNY